MVELCWGKKGYLKYNLTLHFLPIENTERKSPVNRTRGTAIYVLALIHCIFNANRWLICLPKIFLPAAGAGVSTVEVVCVGCVARSSLMVSVPIQNTQMFFVPDIFFTCYRAEQILDHQWITTQALDLKHAIRLLKRFT